MAATKRAPERGPSRAPRLARAGDVYAIPLPDGRFGAAQVIAEVAAEKRGPPQIEIAALEGIWDRPPAVRDVASARVLRTPFGPTPGAPARDIVDAALPWWAQLVGNLPPREVFRGPANTHGGSLLVGGSAYWVERHAALPEEKRAKKTRASFEEVEVDVGGGVSRLRRDTWKVYLDADGTLRPPARGPVRWEALDALPALSEIHYRGDDAGFVELLARRRAIRSAGWLDHGQRGIDLSRTHLDSLVIDGGDKTLSLQLPRSLSSLHLLGRLERLSVSGRSARFPFTLDVDTGALPPPIAGLEELEALTVWSLRDSDARALAAYPALRELTLRGAPGGLRHTEGLTALTKLHELTTDALYGLDMAGFPDAGAMPALEYVCVRGIAKEDVAALKSKLRGVPRLEITGARPRAWIEANLDNPFRTWADDDERLGKAAMAAWKKAAMAAAKLGAKPKRADAEAVLRALVAALNALDGKYGIDTIRREEAGEAFFALASKLGVPDERAETWFDAWRDF